MLWLEIAKNGYKTIKQMTSNATMINYYDGTSTQKVLLDDNVLDLDAEYTIVKK